MAHPRSRVPVHQAEKLKAEMRKTREEVTVSYDLLLSWEEREQREQEEKKYIHVKKQRLFPSFAIDCFHFQISAIVYKRLKLALSALAEV